MPRDKQVYAFLTVVVVDANMLAATRVHREAPCTARPMAGASVVSLRDATRGLRGARLYARATVEASGAFLKVAELARRAYMVVLTTVWPMEVGNDALSLAVRRVPVDVLIAA